MNKISPNTVEFSSGFDELDDDFLDLDAPIRPMAELEDQVYSSQLSFPAIFGKEPSPNLSLMSSDGDSGFNLSMTTIEPVSPLSSCIFDAPSIPITFNTPNLSQQIYGRNEANSKLSGTSRTTALESVSNDLAGNSSSYCEIIDSDGSAPNSEEESIGELAFLSCIPVSILKLFRQVRDKYSDYSFAHLIAAQMCHRTFPIDSYQSMKLGLMLSIISTHSLETPPISIIAIGRDSVTMATLMNDFRAYAQRFYTPSGDLKMTRSQRNGTFVEANSLLMATHGVCFIGDWSSYNASCSAYVKNVLDSGRIIVDAQTNVDFTLKCAIWSYWFCCGTKKSIENVTMFSNVFGIPIVFEENQTNTLIDKMLAENGARDISADDAELYIDADEMQTFFNFIGRRPVCFSDEAELLLKEYFVTSRLNRATLLSQRSLGILRQMSACHAKLCLRYIVQRNDVIACIVLCEKFIFQIHGIEKSNAPFLGPIQHIFEVDFYMQAFEKWLNASLGVYGRRSGID